MTGDADPLILTARFDAASAGMFQRLRNQHFPATLNIVPAHCTLFHHLPGAAAADITALLRTAGAAQPPIAFTTAGMRFIGRGVAVEIAAPPLVALRQRLAQAWADVLTAQDRQGFRPHVTVQNKVAPAAARALHAQLAADLAPLGGAIEGLDLWHYRGGPWEAAAFVAFPR